MHLVSLGDGGPYPKILEPLRDSSDGDNERRSDGENKMHIHYVSESGWNGCVFPRPAARNSSIRFLRHKVRQSVNSCLVYQRERDSSVCGIFMRLLPFHRTTACLNKSRIRTGRDQGKQMHSSTLWTLEIQKMYMGNLGYLILIIL